MNRSIGDWMRRPLRYVYIDGFIEIAIGALFLVSALLLLLFAVALDRPALAAVIGATALLLVIVLGLLVKRLVEAAKERLTYRRTGFVQLRPGATPRWTHILLILAALGLASASLFLPDSFQQSGFALGALLTLILALFGLQTGWLRFYLVAAAVALLTLAASQWISGEAAVAAFVLGGSGAILGMSGGWALSRYLQRTTAEQDHG
ncbi:MAG: hypothetical protein WBR18_01175 [Anaerolineales bacterium]